MPGRTLLVFWAAVSVSVLLLGGAFATLRRVIAGGGTGDYAVLVITVLGLAGSLLVAGRIVLIGARAQRAARGGYRGAGLGRTG